ncbi:FAD-dependent monooxygenase [Streptomyces sp. H10-C2]|uniref:FAD-dependent monooxygenase n=1 Tax=unclassified Streptomyces TaxID=2593676 RepID=UPI0024B8870D|nr:MULTISPECIES: FAD-dependent monooxygenase [unclassified Streptomyces]MDJ0346942.1 FAD-dependent monooxygenase [Streptomyces sp. PH10-H1]MDJ0370465.1 FAD-dependent monooxygenase [Streptomyces sp. H10-C2]
MAEERTPVLVVGGSMVGLSAALFLSHQGFPPLVVERHRTVSVQPRAQAASPRTMEILRALQLEADVRAAETPNAQYGNIMQVESLAGPELGWFDGPFPADPQGVSATGWTLIGQDRLEPVIKRRAEELGADIRFGTEMVSYTQDEEGVTARIRSVETGEEHDVRADYLFAADGNRSPIREGLGIKAEGPGAFGRQLIMIFHADLTALVAGREFFLCFVKNADVHGVLGQLDPHTHRWCLAVSLLPDESAADYTDDRCLALIRAAVGVPDLDVEVESGQDWEIAAKVAERFRHERVFLAGDAAHVMPPTGGFGGNMGIQDAHNLAWKLALVLRGLARPSLLDSYEPERLPVAEFTVEQGVIRYLQRNGLDEEIAARHRPEPTVLFGQRYRSVAVLADPDGDDDGAVFEDPHQATGRPGTRAPHFMIDRPGGSPVPLHDLIAHDFVLLASDATDDGRAWLAAAPPLAARSGIGVLAQPAGPGFTTSYGVGEGGAVLVRPDGFIAWRSRGRAADPAAVLADALSRAAHSRAV